MREYVILIVDVNGSGKTIHLVKETLATINPDAMMQEIQTDLG